MRTQFHPEDRFDRSYFSGRDAIEIEKRLLEMAALEAANDAQAHALSLPAGRSISFADFIALSVSPDVQSGHERFYISFKGLHHNKRGGPLIGAFSAAVTNLIEESRQYDEPLFEYSCKTSAAIFSFFTNTLKIEPISSPPISSVAVETYSKTPLGAATRVIANACTDPKRALAALANHRGEVRFSMNNLVLVEQDADRRNSATLVLDFNRCIKTELRDLLKEWRKYNHPPSPTAYFVNGSPFTAGNLSKHQYFCRALALALYEKFSILPDSRLAPVELKARQLEERFDLMVFTKTITTSGSADYHPAFVQGELEIVEDFLEHASILRPFFDRVSKVDATQKFNGSANDLREIMQLSLFDFTFQRLTQGRIEAGTQNMRHFGTLSDSSKYQKLPPINFRTGPRALGFTPITLAALASTERDYFDIVFLEVSQLSTLQLQLDRRAFITAWHNNISETVNLVQQRLKIAPHKSLGGIVDILIGRVLLDIQRTVNTNQPVKLSELQRDWVLANLGVSISKEGRPQRALPYASG